VFLGQIDGSFIGNTEVDRQLTNEKHTQVIVLAYQCHDSTHGNQADG
jgi:hypothetical protein